MNLNTVALRFSGHDTFHCKEQWILKGLQLVDNKEDGGAQFKDLSSIPKLGVGKNMVRSIHHWLRSFGVLDADNKISELGNLLFIVDKLDPYLENEGSLWLLQYHICATDYASIYKIIFSEFFSDKATLEFSESQILRAINRKIINSKIRSVTANTLKNDYKVFIRTYVSPVKNEKTVEDDFNAPLLELNLISDTKRKNSLNQHVYRIERKHQIGISNEIFIYCLLNEFKNATSISLDNIRSSIGGYLCLSNEGLEEIIEEVCNAYEQFNYKDDAGIRQLQIKKLPPNFKRDIIKKYYGVQ